MKMALLLRVLEITKLQGSALRSEDIDKWSELLGERQNDIDELEAINKGNKTVYSTEERQLLEQIIEIDKLNRQEFDRQYEEVQQNLKKIRSQKKVGNVYSNPYDISQEEGIFFDKR